MIQSTIPIVSIEGFELRTVWFSNSMIDWKLEHVTRVSPSNLTIGSKLYQDLPASWLVL